MLKAKLKPAIHSKRREPLSTKEQPSCHQGDNASLPCSDRNLGDSAATAAWASSLYSPELVPWYYQVFCPLKETLRPCRFRLWWCSYFQAQIWVLQQLEDFSQGVEKLVEEYKKSIYLQEDYIKIWYNSYVCWQLPVFKVMLSSLLDFQLILSLKLLEAILDKTVYWTSLVWSWARHCKLLFSF